MFKKSEVKNMNKKEIWTKIEKTNLLPLAFLGDSVHTLFVREKILLCNDSKMANYHSSSSKFCKASAQAKALEKISPLLNEKESEIVRRARNAHPKHSAKNASSRDYCMATAFEALIGYLYLTEQTERLNKILEISTTEE